MLLAIVFNSRVNLFCRLAYVKLAALISFPNVLHVTKGLLELRALRHGVVEDFHVEGIFLVRRRFECLSLCFIFRNGFGFLSRLCAGIIFYRRFL